MLGVLVYCLRVWITPPEYIFQHGDEEDAQA
jgi:hypothetical protein